MFMYTLFYRKPLLLFWVARRRFYRLKVEADCSLIDSDARRRLLKAQSKLGLGFQTWPFLKVSGDPERCLRFSQTHAYQMCADLGVF